MLTVFDRELSCLYYWVVENLNDRQKFAVFLLLINEDKYNLLINKKESDMKKLLLFLLTAFIACQWLHAQNAGGLNYFNLVLPDNSMVSYELADGIDISFQDSTIVVNDVSIYLEEGVKYYFSENDISAVNEIVVDDSYVSGNMLYVKSQSDGNIVISDVLGRVVYNKPNCKACVIDLSVLAPNSLYIIKINTQTIKFVRR